MFVHFGLQRESNTRFVRWSDGSLQLLIGNEVLDISVQDAQHDQAHLFLRHQKVICQICLMFVLCMVIILFCFPCNDIWPTCNIGSREP